MGQYYLAIILADKNTNESNESNEPDQLDQPEIIRIFMEPHQHNNGAKLTEHSYLKNNFIQQFEFQLTKDGMFYKSRPVWAGDYADNEPNSESNLYHIAQNFPNKNLYTNLVIQKEYPYIVNHTKKQYVNKKKFTTYHPLPLLLAEGNGRGGGDYHGSNEDKIGIWARDVISVDEEIPEGFEEYDTGYCKDSVIEI